MGIKKRLFDKKSARVHIPLPEDQLLVPLSNRVYSHSLQKSRNLYSFATPPNSKKLISFQDSSKKITRASHHLKNLNELKLSKIVTSVSPESHSYKKHLYRTHQSLKLIRNLREVASREIDLRAVFLPPMSSYKKTVIFDLDETLVHCRPDPSNAQTELSVKTPTGETVLVGLNVRPYVNELLRAASHMFEVIVFTASLQCYADCVLNLLDPQGTLIRHRFYRDSCVYVDGLYVKDLRIFKNRELENVVIVDNATYSFAYQLSNGIPIISWYDDPKDVELLKLIDYLKFLSGFHDVREANKQVFKLHNFNEDFYSKYRNKK